MTPDFTKALEEQGYTVLFVIGFKEDRDDYRIKLAAAPAVRMLSPRTWDALVLTITETLDQLYEAPMDDLEITRDDP